MKHFYISASFALLATVGTAQVTLDNFEAGVTGWSVNGNANEAVVAYPTSGANGTANSAELQDGGFSYAAWKTYTGVVPANGNYKISFYYQNGHVDLPQRSAKVQINGADQFIISGNPATVVNTWTAAETGIFSLTTADTIEFRVVAANGAAAAYKMLLDEIVLQPVAVVPITNKVRPLNGSLIAGSTQLTVVPSGGSGTYTSVGFDIGNNTTIDFTDSTSADGFSYTWDTTTETSGPIQVRVVATDSNSLTGQTITNFTIDNENGRETLFSSGFEAWTAGLPDGWTRVDYNDANPAVTSATTAVISEETANPYAGAKSLRINYPTNPHPSRYTILSTPFAGNRTKYQVSFAYRGSSFVRVAYFRTDDGAAWTTTHHLFDPGAGSVWSESIDPAWDNGTDPAFLPQSMAIATHMFGIGDYYADNVVVTASGTEVAIPNAASDWDLFY